MKIGIDARMYGPKQGGLGRYVEQLVLELEKIDNQNEFVIFLRADNWNEYTPSKPNFKKVLANISWYGWQEQFKLTPIIKKEKVDLMHFPHWNIPLFYNDPFIVTIHDLILLHYSTRQASTLGPITYWFKNLLFKKVLRHAVNKAEHIITPSEFTKQDVMKNLNIPPEKITTTLLAPNQHYSNTTQQQFNNLTIQQFNITKPYILYVGVAFPHKNLEGLLKAWKIFCEKYGNNYQLVLAGKKNYFYQTIINNLTIQQFNNVTFIDFPSDSELSFLYKNASLFVFPSLYEGFGIPPLEAMQINLPVASSSSSCLPEILEDAAVYFDPNNYPEMADTIYSGLTNQNLRQNLQKNAIKLLAKYSWHETAKKTSQIYLMVDKSSN
ncbi:MAG: Glycosyl transferase, group 1 [Candidatus Magasanikbacteria bacterium GW2011_GWC2_34_16]|uniref:Glycosyl transferase, group 1 n=2 Tax=Candidatus Magasanikiibacteriota TaxID=1752731 RepID=A0A0G0JWK8_9BACT|nr:MAG: Glycosyl transferase, group 1 [Candidatus Magasanikbacteria bacterium GW2011_GWC2_34_16]KKQ41234.1 MAG: Glycosyl transferase, group 1 [Candidatus Magasanikbacteria bacterium GW2011_GWA2_37_8]